MDKKQKARPKIDENDKAKRRSFSCTDKEFQLIEAMAQENGYSVSLQIRKIINEWVKTNG